MLLTPTVLTNWGCKCWRCEDARRYRRNGLLLFVTCLATGVAWLALVLS